MGKRLEHSQDAVSEVVGYTLLLGIIVVAIGIISMTALPVIQDAKEKAYLKNMEQGFTVLDSKASLVSIGKQPTQIVQMYTQAGGITVNDSSLSRIKVSFTNGTTTYVVYDESMGTIQYQLGDNKIAYEGGGVFRKYPGEGDPVIITPPEFHYNGETLTLPIIRINSNQSVGGTGVVTLRLVSEQTPNVLFPNPDDNPEYTNPLLLGKQINVVIKSDYYKAWAKYIEERTEAAVTTNDATKETTVSLNAKPNDQTIDLSPPIDVYGFNVDNESALHNFNFTLPDGTSNLDMRMMTSPTKTEPYFSFDLKKSGGLATGGVTITLEYHASGKKEEWLYDVQPLKDDDSNFNVNLLNDSGTIYKSADSSWTWENETSPWNKTFSINDAGPNGNKLMQHYLSLVGPTFSFYPDSSPHWNGFNESETTYVLHYEVMPPRITYLHIVEHKMQVNV
ncbi:MAG: hypothetical protein K8R08_11810 [Methanosarcinales archaeon]|nr:hypothetical protein [Methanosarcinales archaeon]